MGLGTALALNLLWVNLSEIFRYFLFVMPMMRQSLAMVPDIAPMNLPVFMVWGLWDTILVLAVTFASWLMLERFGHSIAMALLAGTAVWMAIFVILWLALVNMNLASPRIVLIALPLAWIEMVVAAEIVRWCIRRW